MAFKMKGYSAFTKSPMKQDVTFKEGDPKWKASTGKDISQTFHLTFDQAFAAARKAGKKTFTWKGKSYHTKTKEEVEGREKPRKVKELNPVEPAEPAEPAKLERP